MKGLVKTLVLSLMLGSVSFVSMGTTRGNHSGNNRQQTQTSMSRPGQGKPQGGSVTRPGGNSMSRPGQGSVKKNDMRPAPKPAPEYRVSHNKRGYMPSPTPPDGVAPIPLYDTLSRMVMNTLCGGQLIDLWQISPDTFMMKYRIGNSYYSRSLYPYSNSYGSQSRISVGWSPSSFMTLIPSINLNISL